MKQWNIELEDRLNEAIGLLVPHADPSNPLCRIGGALSHISTVAAVLHNHGDGWVRDRPPTAEDASERKYGGYVWAYDPSIKKHPVRSILWTYVAEKGLIWQPIIDKPEIPTEFR